MPKMGLVLQGGGALGAYEYGAVTRLVELGWQPAAVTGVSIGAATAAAVAGAPDGDICKSLKLLWEAITLHQVPFWPPERQTTFSALAIRVFGACGTTCLVIQTGRVCMMCRLCVRRCRRFATSISSMIRRICASRSQLQMYRRAIRYVSQTSWAIRILSTTSHPGFHGIAHTRSHLGKWQSAPWLPDDCD